MRNRIGLSTDPCRTPDVTGTKSDSSPSRTTDGDRLPKKAWIQFSAFPLIPYWWSFQSNYEWLTLSNVFEKSNGIKSVCLSVYPHMHSRQVPRLSWWAVFHMTFFLEIHVEDHKGGHMLNHIWSFYMFEDLAQDASEGNRSVVGSRWLVPLFKDWCY